MTIGLYKYNGDINDRNSQVVLSENIASQSFYDKFWEKAIFELKIKFIQDGAEFDNSKLNEVIKELDLLKDWAMKNLHGQDLEYMRGRIENLQNIVPNAFDSDDTILYIF